MTHLHRHHLFESYEGIDNWFGCQHEILLFLITHDIHCIVRGISLYPKNLHASDSYRALTVNCTECSAKVSYPLLWSRAILWVNFEPRCCPLHGTIHCKVIINLLSVKICSHGPYNESVHMFYKISGLICITNNWAPECKNRLCHSYLLLRKDQIENFSISTFMQFNKIGMFEWIHALRFLIFNKIIKIWLIKTHILFDFSLFV